MKTKQVVQLDHEGYFVGLTNADESPLEKGVWMMPAGTIDVSAPDSIPDNQRAKWENNQWTFEEVVEESIQNDPTPLPPSELIGLTYDKKRAIDYPSYGDQLDALFHAGVFPEDMAAKIQAVKDKHPKE